MYIRKTYVYKDSLEREEYHTGRYGAPGAKRGKKKELTKEQMAEVNLRNKKRKAARLIKNNFQPGDYWVTITYKNRPEEMQEAIDDFQKMIRKIRKAYKKRDADLKYYGSIERGKRGGMHFHLILNRIQETDIILRESWDKGSVHNELMYKDADGGFKQLTDYLMKQPGEKNEDGKPNGMKEKWESHSRNLQEPKMEKKTMPAGTFRKGIRPPKGYYLDKDSLEEGINAYTGFKYRRYTLIKIEEQNKKKRRN